MVEQELKSIVRGREKRTLEYKRAWAKAQRGYAFFAFIPTLVGGAVTIAHLVDEATALKDIEEWEKRQGE